MCTTELGPGLAIDSCYRAIKFLSSDRSPEVALSDSSSLALRGKSLQQLGTVLFV